MGNCTSMVRTKDENNKRRVDDENGCHSHKNALHIIQAYNNNDNNQNQDDLLVGSVHSRQGSKCYNQDSALLFQGYGMLEGRTRTLCGVFDGHGSKGQIVSRVVRNRLPALLHNQMKFMESNNKDACFVSSFKAMDKEIKLLDSPDCDCTFSGTTAVVALLQGKDVVIANLGDSRAVVGRVVVKEEQEEQVEAVQLTVDQKPGVESEKDRIIKAGGRVFAHPLHIHDDEQTQTNNNNTNTVTTTQMMRMWLPDEDLPGLAMSRAFGDFDVKDYGIISTPELTHYRLTSDDLFLVLACDGVWDVLTNEEVVNIVVTSVKNNNNNKKSAAKAVVDKAHAAWKHKFPSSNIDDCTALCLFFQH